MEIKKIFEIENADKKVYNFLKKIDVLFKVPISKKVSFEEYIIKIKKMANSYVMVAENEIIGEIIFYKNDQENYIAYIALVGVLKEYQNKGIANSLLKKCIEDLKNSPMKKVGIHTDNMIAKKIYEKYGFEEVSEINGRYYLELKLK
jgi:ribosomal protein S18 acetylase RimI-like enzyme